MSQVARICFCGPFGALSGTGRSTEGTGHTVPVTDSSGLAQLAADAAYLEATEVRGGGIDIVPVYPEREIVPGEKLRRLGRYPSIYRYLLSPVGGLALRSFWKSGNSARALKGRHMYLGHLQCAGANWNAPDVSHLAIFCRRLRREEM